MRSTSSVWESTARRAKAAKAARAAKAAMERTSAAAARTSSSDKKLSPSPRPSAAGSTVSRLNDLGRKSSAAKNYGEGATTLVHTEPAVPDVATKYAPTRLDEDDDFSSNVVSIAFGESRSSADDEVRDMIRRDVLSSPAAPARKVAAGETDQSEENKTVCKEDGEDVRCENNKKSADDLWELKGPDLGEAMPSPPSTPVPSSRSSSGEGLKESNSSTPEACGTKNENNCSALPAIDELEKEDPIQSNEADHDSAPGEGAAVAAAEDKMALKEAVSLSSRSETLTKASETQIPREAICHDNTSSSYDDASPLTREGESRGEKTTHTSKEQVAVRQSASSAGNKSTPSAEDGRKQNGDSVFDFEAESISMSPTEKNSPPLTRGAKRISSGRRAKLTEVSPSRRKRKRRLTEQIEQARSPFKKKSSSLLQSPSTSSTSSYVAFSESLVKVHSTDVRGSYAPGKASNFPPLLRASPSRDSAPSLFRISDAPPPRRVQYRNEKTMQRSTEYIRTSLTNMDATASSESTTICYWKTLGRCHIKEDSDSGFQWFEKSIHFDSFISTDFLGYNEGLGRVYFSSFFHRGRKIRVGSFVKRRNGAVVDFLRVVGVYQATKSFLGYWEDGAVVMKGASKRKKRWKKEQIQKRGHPYMIGVPLRLKSDVESGKARKALQQGRKNGCVGSDIDHGFTSCASEGDSKAKAGTTRRKRQKGACVDAQIREEEVEQELVLEKESESPNHIWMLPEWLGIEGVTLEPIDVAVQNETGEVTLVRGNELGSKKRASSFAEGNFVCCRALTKELWKMKKPRTKKGAKKDPWSDLFSPHLSGDQFALLTSPPIELLQDNIPLIWDVRFEAAQAQFIKDDRDWWNNDKPVPGFMYEYTGESSDDSDGFDEGSRNICAEAAFTSEPDDGEAVLLLDSESDTEKQSRNSDAVSDNEALEGSGTEGREGENESRYTDEEVANSSRMPLPLVDPSDRTQNGEVSAKYPPARPAPSVGIDDLRNKTELLYNASGKRRGKTLPSKRVLIKGAAYLRKKASDSPDLQEPLPLMFVHKKDEEIRPQLCAEDATPAPRYVVERKDNSLQVASRMAYLIDEFNGGRPRCLCYCLKNTYARSMATQLNKIGVKAKALLPGDDESQTFRTLSSGYLDVLCIGGDGLPRLDLIFHVYVPSSLQAYADETMLAAKHPPFLCVLFHRYRDITETRKSLGLLPHSCTDDEPMQAEMLLADVLRYCSNGSSCRVSLLLDAMDQNTPIHFGGEDCCDNCRSRLNLEGSPLSLMDENRSIALGSGSSGKQDVVSCNLDMTKYFLESLRSAQVHRKDDIKRHNLSVSFKDAWIQTDYPSGSGRVSACQYARMSPLRCLSKSPLLCASPFHLLTAQGIVTGLAKRNTLVKLDSRMMARFMKDAEEGNLKIVLHNFRLLRLSLDTEVVEDEGIQLNRPADESCVAAPAQGEGDNRTTMVVKERANLQEAPLNSPLSLHGDSPVPSNGRTSAQDEDSEEDYGSIRDLLEDSQDPELQKELRIIRNGEAYFPRLKMPLRSISWIRKLPHVVQYELWRLMNARPVPLTRSLLEGDIKAYFEQNRSLNTLEACVHINSLAKSEDSVRDYSDILKKYDVQRSPEGPQLLFSATFSIPEHCGGCGVDMLALLAPKPSESCRLFRKFGSNRFLLVALPRFYDSMHLLNRLEQDEAFFVAGRYYRYFWADLESSPQSLVFFAESGVDIGEDDQMTVGDVRDWCLPKKLNDTLTIVDEHVYIGLCLAPTTRSGTLPPDSVIVIDTNCSVDAQGTKSCGGCGLISRDALDFVWSSYSKSNAEGNAREREQRSSEASSDWESSESSDGKESNCPYSSFEGMIGGMRGVWVLDCTLGEGIKVVCRSSQQLFALPMTCLQSPSSTGTSSPVESSAGTVEGLEAIAAESEGCSGQDYDDAYDTMEIVLWDADPTEGTLNTSLIQALETRGVSPDYFKKYADEGMRRIERRCRTQLSAPESTMSGQVMMDAMGLRKQSSYPVRRCKNLRLIPDHTNILKPGESFVACSSERDARHLERSNHLLATASSTIYEDDIQKLKIVSRDEMWERCRDRPDCFHFFNRLKTGLVVNTEGRDPAEITGGVYFGKIWVCWDDRLVSQVRDVEVQSSKPEGPRLEDKSKRLMSETSYVYRAKYRAYCDNQRRRAKELQNLLCILNDLLGMDNVQSRQIATEVYMLTKYPFHLHVHDCDLFFVDKSQLKYPDWFELPPSSSSTLARRRYESPKALGKLWQYMQYKIDVCKGSA